MVIYLVKTLQMIDIDETFMVTEIHTNPVKAVRRALELDGVIESWDTETQKSTYIGDPREFGRKR